MHPIKMITALAFIILAATPVFAADPVSGNYSIDPDHTSVTFKVNHLGFSRYTGRFDKTEGTLDLNTAALDKSNLDVTIYPNSINTNNVKLEEELRGGPWFDVIKYPRMTFHATKIEKTGPTTAKITGDFTMKGKTHAVVLDASLIGAGTHPFKKVQVVGFSATGTLKRSDFDVSNLLPMVGDDVTIQIETEFDSAAPAPTPASAQ
jgi:hypothetical protein